MKVIGEAFSYEKRSRRGTMYDTFKLSGKRTLTGQNSGKFFSKHRRGNFSLSINNEKNLSDKKTEQGKLLIFFFSVFFIYLKNKNNPLV